MNKVSESGCCPLCGSGAVETFASDERRDYLVCSQCALVFVPAGFHLNNDDEKALYDLHQNSPDDQGYRQFLSRLATPLMKRLPEGGTGLDFGSGPGPTLSVMFEESGYAMRLFDKYYADDETVWAASYDFITSTEVIEHLSSPAELLNKLWQCLKPGGYLGLMTKLRLTEAEAFARWHYRQDPTHICFYAPMTMSWMADYWEAELEILGKDVIIFRKST